MKSVCRSIGIGWLCSAMLVGSGLAQQNDPAAKAEADRKAAAAKAAGADIEKLQAARAALAAQREAALNAQKNLEAAAAMEAAKKEAQVRLMAAAATKQKAAVAQAAEEVQKAIADLHAAEAAKDEKAIREHLQHRQQVL